MPTPVTSPSVSKVKGHEVTLLSKLLMQHELTVPRRSHDHNRSEFSNVCQVTRRLSADFISSGTRVRQGVTMATGMGLSICVESGVQHGVKSVPRVITFDHMTLR